MYVSQVKKFKTPTMIRAIVQWEADEMGGSVLELVDLNTTKW